MSSGKPFWLIKCERSYGDTRQLFLLGNHEGAFDGFKSVCMEKVDFRDVAQIVNDYYSMAKDDWVANYDARFRLPHETA
jgi:hypothetical protein